MVVGSGVIGAACSHFLTELGYEITILDRADFGSQCSSGNCGNICPSHIAPLAEPGAVRHAVLSWLRGETTVFIKPRLDLPLLTWLYQFSRHCTKRSMLDACRANHALLNQSRHLYEELITRFDLACEWHTEGNLYVFLKQKTLATHDRKQALMAKEFSLSGQRLEGEELTDFEPALRSGLAGGWYYPSDAHLRPDRLLQSWRDSLNERGATIVEHLEVTGLATSGSTATHVITRSGDVAADHFVFTTGALTPKFSSQLGCRLPIQPGKGYSLTMRRPELCPALPVHFVDHNVVATPMDTALRIGSIMEFSGYDDRLNPDRLQALKSGARQYLQKLEEDPTEAPWCGWRPMTPNGLPRIGPCPIANNVYVAAGHNMLGMSMAPATGQLIAQMIDRRTLTLDPRPYAVNG